MSDSTKTHESDEPEISEHERRLMALRDLMPEAFKDGDLDAEALVDLLGGPTSPDRETFGLSWAGKAEAIRALRATPRGALLPDSAVEGFDAAGNAFIEGDNLEVLRLLQRAYDDQVKLIYIDPPYNVDGDFVYNDDFSDSLAQYLKYTGQVDDEGARVSATSEASGRKHSGWLSFMYPRLVLARNLLRRDGLIFVSIDDTEMHLLRTLMDWVFDEENFLAALIWDRNHSQQQGQFKKYHEYVLVYARDKSALSPFVAAAAPIDDDDEEDATATNGEILAGAQKKVSKKNPSKEFTFPAGVRCEAPDGTTFMGTWGDAEATELIDGTFEVKDGKTTAEMTLAAGWTQASQMQEYFHGDREEVIDTRGQRVLEFFFTASGKLKCRKDRSRVTPSTVRRWGTQGQATAALGKLMGDQFFETPKPVGMLREIITWTTSGDDIVLDFFAGSATTAHAVIEQNAADGGTRRFVLVNLPEATPENSKARAAGYDTVSAIGRKRIEIVSQNAEDAAVDVRFFQLGPSSFKIWEPLAPDTSEEAIQEALLDFTDTTANRATPDQIVAEVLLSEGVRLDVPWERVTVEGEDVVIAERIAVWAGTAATREIMDGLVALDADKIVVRDRAFQGQDPLKGNLAMAAKAAGRLVRIV